MRTMTHYAMPAFRLELVSEYQPGLDYEPAKVKTPHDLSDILHPLAISPNERFVILMLNARHEGIGVFEVSQGSLSASLVHPREVFKAAILANAYAIICAHNHPSCSRLAASQDDLDTTKQLAKAAEFMGINLLDHVILSPQGDCYSIRENHPEMWAKDKEIDEQH